MGFCGKSKMISKINPDNEYVVQGNLLLRLHQEQNKLINNVPSRESLHNLEKIIELIIHDVLDLNDYPYLPR
jgi:hypothetical protein